MLHINVYACDACGAVINTVQSVEGTTPFQISCLENGCSGGAISSLGQRWPEPTATIYGWRKATENEVELMSMHEKHHHSLGGLFLYDKDDKRAES